jgi:hypothetical protein
MKQLSLTYCQPADDSAAGWERESLPLGNGFLGPSSTPRFCNSLVHIELARRVTA